MENSLFSSEFVVLYESKLFITKKYRIWVIKGDLGAENDLLQNGIFWMFNFSLKPSLPQRQIWLIGVTFWALSIGDVKISEKSVQQVQKLRILLNSTKLLWGTSATSIGKILKSIQI